MPKPRPAKPVPPTRKAAPPRRPWVGAAVRRLVLASLIVGGTGYATVAGRRFVEATDAADAAPITVELADRPAWMSDYLAGQIAAVVPHGPASPFDHDLLVTAARRLAANPWVKSVRQVRRTYRDAPGDTIVADCDYRVPAALVQWGRSYWLVDNDGVKLPEPFTAEQVPRVTTGPGGRTAVRVITGVEQRPPTQDGAKWAGADLAAGLDMAKLLYGKPYLDGVTSIDVSNLNGRLHRGEPQVVLGTRYGTEVRWGRPPLADDFYVEQPVARKLATLAAVVKQYGRVDAGRPWLDVRLDVGLLPAEDPVPPAPAGNTR